MFICLLKHDPPAPRNFADNFVNSGRHRFADVFDDVIVNVRASGDIGGIVDDCMRGAVDV